MNRWDRFNWREQGLKRPPPAHGIKIEKAGTSWWGKLWLEALESALGADAGRLSRGRTYARAGRTHDLTVKGGQVRAQVTGSRAEPYEVTIKTGQLSDETWQRIIAAMSEQAQFSAELLSNQMPERLDELFRAAGTSLFPRERADLATTCTCPDWGDPCKHVAAAHYVLGDALDRDPFLLFELRGRSKEQVLSALRNARAATTSDAHEEASARVATVTVESLGAIDAASYDAPNAAPAMQFSFAAPTVHGAVLGQLGVPSAWRGKAPPAETLAPLIRAAAEHARRIAFTEPETRAFPPMDRAKPGAAKRPPKSRAPKRG